MSKKRETAYEKLKFYQDICQVRKTIYKITGRFYRSHIRLVSQMRDAARSAKQNIREGYKRGSAGEFAQGIRISRGSLEELSGDLEDCFEDQLISPIEFDKLTNLIQSADYLSYKYLISLQKMRAEDTWKEPKHRKS